LYKYQNNTSPQPSRRSGTGSSKGEIVLDYKVIYSRRRSITISISPHNGVVIRAPKGVSLERIDRFVNEKSAWINKHIDNYSGSVRINYGKKYIDGECHFFMGKEHILKLIQSPKPFVREYNDTIEVGLPDTSNNSKVKALMDKWYRERAMLHFRLLLDKILLQYESYHFNPSAIVVRPSKSRWGSCSSKGKISISSELIKLDEKFYEYIIIHELCHLKHPNHGIGFYKLLEELLPDYKQVRKELRKFVMR
jgi:predicted metal-dependent hydrolase